MKVLKVKTEHNGEMATSFSDISENVLYELFCEGKEGVEVGQKCEVEVVEMIEEEYSKLKEFES